MTQLADIFKSPLSLVALFAILYKSSPKIRETERVLSSVSNLDINSLLAELSKKEEQLERRSHDLEQKSIQLEVRTLQMEQSLRAQYNPQSMRQIIDELTQRLSSVESKAKEATVVHQTIVQQAAPVENKTQEAPVIPSQQKEFKSRIINWGALPTWSEAAWDLASPRSRYAGLLAHALTTEALHKQMEELVDKEETTERDFYHLFLHFGVPAVDQVKKHGQAKRFKELVAAFHQMTALNHVAHEFELPKDRAHTVSFSFNVDMRNRWNHKQAIHFGVDYSYEEDGKTVHVLGAETEQPIVFDKARIHFDVELPAGGEGKRAYKFYVRAAGSLTPQENVPVWNPVERKLLEGSAAQMVALLKRSLNIVHMKGASLHPPSVRQACREDGNRVIVSNNDTYFVTFVSSSSANESAFAPNQRDGVVFANGLCDIAGARVDVAEGTQTVEAYHGWTLDDFVAWYFDDSELVTRPGMFLHGKRIQTDDEGRQYIDVPLYANGQVPLNKEASLMVKIDDSTTLKAHARLYRYSTLENKQERDFVYECLRRGLAASMFGQGDEIVYKISSYDDVIVERRPGHTLSDDEFEKLWARVRSSQLDHAEQHLLNTMYDAIFCGHLERKRGRVDFDDSTWGHIKSLYRSMYEHGSLSHEILDDPKSAFTAVVKFIEGLINPINNDTIAINMSDSRQTLGLHDNVLRSMTKDHDPWHMFSRTERGIEYHRTKPEGRMCLQLFANNLPWAHCSKGIKVKHLKRLTLDIVFESSDKSDQATCGLVRAYTKYNTRDLTPVSGKFPSELNARNWYSSSLLFNTRPGNANLDASEGNYLRNKPRGHYVVDLDYGVTVEKDGKQMRRNVFTQHYFNCGLDVSEAEVGEQEILALTLETDPYSKETIDCAVRSAKLEYDLNDGAGVRTKWIDFAKRTHPVHQTVSAAQGRGSAVAIDVKQGTRVRDILSLHTEGTLGTNGRVCMYTKPMGHVAGERLAGTSEMELMRGLAFGERDFDVCLGRMWVDLSQVEKQTHEETKGDLFQAELEWRDAIGNTINVVYEPSGHKDEQTDTFTLTTNMGTEAQVYTNQSTARYFVEVVRLAESEKISMRVYDAAGWVTTPEIDLKHQNFGWGDLSVKLSTKQGEGATRQSEFVHSPLYAGADLIAHDMTDEHVVPSEGDADEAFRSKLVHRGAGGLFSLTADPDNWDESLSKTTRYMEKDGWNAYIGGWNDVVDRIVIESESGAALTKHSLVYVDGSIVNVNYQ